MTRLEAVAAAAVLSGIVLTPIVARSNEPAALHAQYPDRDVLNGGALTPWGAAQAGRGAPRNPYSALDSATSSDCQRYRSYDPQSGTFFARDGRRRSCR
jgi:hypothetical protein